MRKMLLSLCTFSLVCLIFCFTSCKKETSSDTDSGSKSCTCTETGVDGTYTFTEYPSNYNVKSCSDLGSMMSGNGYVVKCK
jgi:hypothetical protein